MIPDSVSFLYSCASASLVKQAWALTPRQALLEDIASGSHGLEETHRLLGAPLSRTAKAARSAAGIAGGVLGGLTGGLVGTGAMHLGRLPKSYEAVLGVGDRPLRTLLGTHYGIRSGYKSGRGLADSFLARRLSNRLRSSPLSPFHGAYLYPGRAMGLGALAGGALYGLPRLLRRIKESKRKADYQ